MKKTIQHFKTLLPCEQFVVTGSYALATYGLCDMAKVKDLDIILVNPSEESLGIIARLQKDSPAKTTPKAGGELVCIIMHNDTKVDFFVKTKKQETVETPDFELAKVDSIITAKKGYNRMKDHIQLRRMSKIFFDRLQFEKYLDGAELKQDEPYAE